MAVTFYFYYFLESERFSVENLKKRFCLVFVTFCYLLHAAADVGARLFCDDDDDDSINDSDRGGDVCDEDGIGSGPEDGREGHKTPLENWKQQ
jgi:hypothetical protein